MTSLRPRRLVAAVLLLASLACGRTGVFPTEAEEIDGGVLLLDANHDVRTTYCGNGRVEPGEDCDDGNTDDLDGCSNTCELVAGDPCSPCERDDDCTGAGARCLELLDGPFCGLGCDSDCPDGFFCTDYTTVAGDFARQCVPELEVCSGCLDDDLDGFGVGAECLGVDCNDSDPTINPLADELCDGIDTNCNGTVDDANALDAPVWHPDADGDGFGDPAVTRTSCEQPAGFVADDTDCNDANPAINPFATEVCDDVDNDCDLGNDEGCPPDLIVDAEEITLSGDHLFDRVEVLNGGVVFVDPFDGTPGDPSSGTPGTGCLRIEARVVFVRADSGFDASHAGGAGSGGGSDAGFGRGLVNSGPTGGGYGGRGGDSAELIGGATYGAAEGAEVEMGSNGGSFFVRASVAPACDSLVGFTSQGGAGGGCISLAAGRIQVDGFIRVTGQNGQNAIDTTQPGIVDGGAGGSGGGIALLARAVSIGPTALLDARGGSGGTGARFSPFGDGNDCVGNGAGGGGGGRIKIVANAVEFGGAFRVEGGRGGTGPQSDAFPGQPGTVSTP